MNSVSIVGVESPQGKRQACARKHKRWIHGLLATIAEGQAFGPGRSDVGQGQAMQVLAMGTSPQCTTRSISAKPRHRLIPIGKGANGTWLLQQGTRFGRAQAMRSAPLSLGAQEAISRGSDSG